MRDINASIFVCCIGKDVYPGRYGYLYKEIKATCARAGIPYLGTHQPGRHSFGTQMIVRSKIDIATTAEKGRWKSKRC